MAPNQNDRPVLLNSQRLRWMPLIGLFPLIITACIAAGVFASGEGVLEEWTTPLIAITAISFFGMLVGGIAVLIDTALEANQISRVLGSPLAVWPQFANPDQWAKAVEQYEEKWREATQPNIGGPIVVTIVIAVIGGFMVANGFGAYVLGLGSFILIIWAIGIGGPVGQRMQAMAHVRRLKGSPIPMTVVSKIGLYDPYNGFISLKGLQRAEFAPPDRVKALRKELRKEVMAGELVMDLSDEFDRRLADQGWGQLVFTVQHRMRLDDGLFRTFIHIYTVRIPPDSFEEAQRVLSSFG